MGKTFYDPGFRLGILGGGQLGRMLLQSTPDINLKSVVLDSGEDMPACGLATEFIKGSFSDYDDVMKLGSMVDSLTIEIEHVNIDALKELEGSGLPVHPQSSVLEVVQDKGLQKQFYRDHGIPTSEFVLVGNRDGIRKHLEFLPAFQKSRKAGYDGRGVQKIRGVEDLDAAFDVPSVLEKFIDFEQELSVIVARSPSGEMKAFPPVGMSFHPEQNLVEYLYAPAGISNDTAREAVELAKKVAEAFEIIGLLAVELFLDKSGKLLVNEVAPRPHNSGHHTIEANITSQYEQHLRAILDLPLGDTQLRSPAVMVNLLGEPGFNGKPVYSGLEEVLGMSDVHVHLYGKAMTKPYRKMGHITILDENISGARKKAAMVKEKLKVIT